jgi:hypothetical protein
MVGATPWIGSSILWWCGEVSGMIFVFYVHKGSKHGEVLFAHYENLQRRISFVWFWFLS